MRPLDGGAGAASCEAQLPRAAADGWLSWGPGGSSGGTYGALGGPTGHWRAGGERLGGTVAEVQGQRARWSLRPHGGLTQPLPHSIFTAEDMGFHPQRFPELGHVYYTQLGPPFSLLSRPG